MLLRHDAFELPILGLYTWDLSINRLIADQVYADIYGFELDEVVQGITIEQAIARMFPADREKVARDIHSAITGGHFASTSYRVVKDGSIRNVLAYGRCLRDVDGVPHIFTGGLQYIADWNSGTTDLILNRHRPQAKALATPKDVTKGIGVIARIVIQKGIATPDGASHCLREFISIRSNSFIY